MKKIFGFLLAVCLVAMLVVTPIGVAAEEASSQPNQDVDINMGETFTPGDLDDNDAINLNDLVLLAQKVAKWEVIVNEKAGDVDGVEGLTLNDVTYLAKHLAGWNGYDLNK